MSLSTVLTEIGLFQRLTKSTLVTATSIPNTRCAAWFAKLFLGSDAKGSDFCCLFIYQFESLPFDTTSSFFIPAYSLENDRVQVSDDQSHASLAARIERRAEPTGQAQRHEQTVNRRAFEASGSFLLCAVCGRSACRCLSKSAQTPPAALSSSAEVNAITSLIHAFNVFWHLRSGQDVHERAGPDGSHEHDGTGRWR